jgi:hypothetical protein
MFGTGAVLTRTPTNLSVGETTLHAPKALEPVDDSMRVQIDLGKVTEEKKREVLSGPFKLTEVGSVEVGICRSPSECVSMKYTGPYFSRNSYGIAFAVVDRRLNGVEFSAVKIRTDRPLSNVVVSWMNYTQ